MTDLTARARDLAGFIEAQDPGGYPTTLQTLRDLADEVERLRAAITDAPHATGLCPTPLAPWAECVCWKAVALAVGAGEDTTND